MKKNQNKEMLSERMSAAEFEFVTAEQESALVLVNCARKIVGQVERKLKKLIFCAFASNNLHNYPSNRKSIGAGVISA
jgi:hypothetical protein